MKIALLLNHCGRTVLIKVSFYIYSLAFLLENEFFYLQITNWITLLTFSPILKLAWDEVKRVPPDNTIAFALHFCPLWLSNLYYASPRFNTITTQWESTRRDRTQRVPGCYPPHNFPFITRHPASLSFFLQMKFLSHHQGEARAAWKRYATSGKRKEICKLNSLFIDIIGSYQLLIPTPDRTKLHGLAESKITVLRIILGHRIKCLGRYLRVHFLLPIHFAKKETETRGR